MGRCCSWREGCWHDLEAGSRKAYGRCWLFSWAVVQNAGNALVGLGAAGGRGSPACSLRPRLTAGTQLTPQSDSQCLQISCKSTGSGPIQDSAGTPTSPWGCLRQVTQVRPSSPSPCPAPSPTETLSTGSPTSPVGPHLTFSLTMVYLQCSY